MVADAVNDDKEGVEISIPYEHSGYLVRKAFEFCQNYKQNPFQDINHPIDNYKDLANFYNGIVDDLTSNDVICLLRLSDYLNIPPLLKLIYYKLSYLMRDISYKKRLQYFGLNDEWLSGSAEM